MVCLWLIPYNKHEGLGLCRVHTVLLYKLQLQKCFESTVSCTVSSVSFTSFCTFVDCVEPFTSTFYLVEGEEEHRKSGTKIMAS